MAGNEKAAGSKRSSKRVRSTAGPPTRFEPGGISKMDLVKKPKQDASGKPSKSTEEWTVRDVSEWLTSFSFGKDYKEVFESNEIAGDTLKDLDDDILRDELGISVAMHRKRMLREIADLLGKTMKEVEEEESDDDDDDDDDDEEEEEEEDEIVSKKKGAAKKKDDDAFNFPSDDESEAKREGSTISKKKKVVAKRSSNASQSSASSSKKTPKKIATKKKKVAANGTAKSASARKAGSSASKQARRGRPSSAKTKAKKSAKQKKDDAPPGKMICPSCEAVIDKDSAMCTECFSVFPEPKKSQFEATSYYRSYRAVPNYRS